MPKPKVSRDALIGQVVGGRYEVLRMIGKGGVGTIYEVRNVRLGRSFALKVLAGGTASSTEAIQRFRREADIVARIKHPNIVDVIDWDELPDGSPCIVMEYLKGEDLASRLKRSARLPWPLIAQVGDQVLAALTVTHASGVVHRDLKPQNVFLAVDDEGEERVKLLDFGVSKIRDLPSLITTDSKLVGTPAYMAPEQAESRQNDVGTHTDIWAMAIMLHEMTTGVRAFDSSSMPAMLYAICHTEPVAIPPYRPDAPAAFVELIAAALVRPINERLADAAVMRARLREALGPLPAVHFGSPLRATPPTGVERPHKHDPLADTEPIGSAPDGSMTMPTGTIAVPQSRNRARLRYGLVGAGTLGAVVIAYGVTRGMQHEPGPPQVVAVPVSNARDAPPTTPDAASADAPSQPAPAEQVVEKPVKHHKPSQPASHEAVGPEHIYVQNATNAINAHINELLACFNAHETAAGDTQIKATIQIAASGRAKQVSFAPDRVDASPLGGCLRAELMSVEYPSSANGQTFSIPLRAKTSR